MTKELREHFGDLVERGVFNPVARHIVGNDQEDRLQDAVAQVWEAFLRYEARGVHLNTGLLVHMVRLRATDLGRRFVRGGQPRRDVMDARNYFDGRTQVLHLDGLEDENEGWSGEGDVGLQAVWRAATSADPAEELVGAIDLDSWLVSLGADDRDLLAGRLAGHSLQELAWRTNRSITAVFQQLRDLGTDLAEHAGVTVKKKIRKQRRRAVAEDC
jgi:hypothetical protein